MHFHLRFGLSFFWSDFVACFTRSCCTSVLLSSPDFLAQIWGLNKCLADAVPAFYQLQPILSAFKRNGHVDLTSKVLKNRHCRCSHGVCAVMQHFISCIAIKHLAIIGLPYMMVSVYKNIQFEVSFSEKLKDPAVPAALNVLLNRICTHVKLFR